MFWLLKCEIKHDHEPIYMIASCCTLLLSGKSHFKILVCIQEHEQMRLSKKREQDEWQKKAARKQSSIVSAPSVDESEPSASPTEDAFL